MLETRTQPYTLKADDEEPVIAGFITTFEDVTDYDSYGDIVDAAALDDDVDAFSDGMTGGPKVLYQHEWTRPIGRPRTLDKSDKGIHSRGRIVETTKDGAETLDLARDGTIDSLSVGMYVVRAEFLEDVETEWGWPVRRITKAELVEWSPVTFPANPFAVITDVRARQHTPISRAIAERTRAGEEPSYVVRQLADAIRGKRQDVWALAAGQRACEPRLLTRMASCLEVPLHRLAMSSCGCGVARTAPELDTSHEPAPSVGDGVGAPDYDLSDLLQRATALADRIDPGTAGA